MPHPIEDLTDAELRDAIQLLQDRKPLPDKYRFLLFEDKRQVELIWNGKTNHVTNTVLPFQTIEVIDEPRATCSTDPMTGFFRDGSYRTGARTKTKVPRLGLGTRVQANYV